MDPVTRVFEQMMINNRLVVLHKDLKNFGRYYGLTEDEVEELTEIIEMTLKEK